MEYCPFEPIAGPTNAQPNQVLCNIVSQHMLGQNENITQIIDIKTELLQSLQTYDIQDVLEKNKDDDNFNKDITHHKQLLTKSTDVIKELMESFQHQQTKVIAKEEQYKQIIEQTSQDIEIIETFLHFILKTHEKYPDVNMSIMEKTVIQTCTEMRDKNKCNEIKQEYQKELYIYNMYLQDFIKLINQGNLGSTCSLCLQRNVDTYLDPCGHTGCSECVQKLKDLGGTDYNCHICR